MDVFGTVHRGQLTDPTRSDFDQLESVSVWLKVDIFPR